MIQQPYQEKRFIDAISKAGGEVGGWEDPTKPNSTEMQTEILLRKNKTINLSWALYVEKV